MAPIDAKVVQRSLRAARGEISACPIEKGAELAFVHLARSHRKGAMMDRAETARMAIDRHVAGRIGEDHGGTFLAHQPRKGLAIERIPAHDAMAAEKPQITKLADRRARPYFRHGIPRIVSRLSQFFERSDPQINFGHLEAGDLKAEVETEQGEVLELLRQHFGRSSWRAR